MRQTQDTMAFYFFLAEKISRKVASMPELQMEKISCPYPCLTGTRLKFHGRLSDPSILRKIFIQLMRRLITTSCLKFKNYHHCECVQEVDRAAWDLVAPAKLCLSRRRECWYRCQRPMDGRLLKVDGMHKVLDNLEQRRGQRAIQRYRTENCMQEEKLGLSHHFCDP